MTVLEEIRETFQSVEIGRIFTTAEIKNMVSEKFGRNPGSIIPSDCCYEMWNKGLENRAFKEFKIFEQVKRGVYRYVGERVNR